jgi:hypothetical protein
MILIVPIDCSYVAPSVREFIDQWSDHPDECWPWDRAMYENGYGRARVNRVGGKPSGTTAHRAVYSALVGPIPDGLDLDHLCRNRACANPAHVEPVTRRENLLRGHTLPAANVAKTHCLRGHEFTPENTRIQRGTRACRECIRVAAARRLEDNRDLFNARSRIYNTRHRAKKKMAVIIGDAE